MSLDARIEFSTYITASQWTQFLQMDPTARRIVGESDPSLLRTNGFADLRHFSDRCQTLGLPPSEHIHANSAAALLYRNHRRLAGTATITLQCWKSQRRRSIASEATCSVRAGLLLVHLDQWKVLDRFEGPCEPAGADPEAPVDPRPAYIRRLRSIWSAGGSETSGAADGN